MLMLALQTGVRVQVSGALYPQIGCHRPMQRCISSLVSPRNKRQGKKEGENQDRKKEEEEFTPWRCLDPLFALAAPCSPNPLVRPLPLHSPTGSISHLCLICASSLSLFHLISHLFNLTSWRAPFAHLLLTIQQPNLLSTSCQPHHSTASASAVPSNPHLVSSYCQAEAGSPIQPGPTAANLAVRGLATVGSTATSPAEVPRAPGSTGQYRSTPPGLPACAVDTAELPFS
ncbi:hypothetical protein V8C44DRAFT_340367 [Trichoderma aethiopicum]